ncbi:protein phosphatase Slingshot homolog 2 isoform X2 [Clinocottus analis]|uniref:protein phosphatase Slingshot homolog 2 isoform X2 n=1 Tax=Clinocottus analis TaxID=304258 RepID=UPI0035BF10A4
MALVTVQRSPTPSTTSSPSVSESGSGEDDRRSQPRSISESFLTVKGAALFLPRGSSPTPSAPCISQRRNKHTGDLQKHLQTMFTVLRPEDTIRLAVRLESAYPQVTRYMVVVSTNGRQDTEESIVLGVDFVSSDSCTVGLVLPLWSDTLIHLDGDGGFSVSTVNRVHVFKPVSVQAMWSALQSLHKASDVARCHNHYPGSLFLTWVSYYQSRVSSNQVCVNEWNAMQDVESHRANSPVLFTDLPTEGERTERLIKMRLREIMMQKDLENVTCKEIRTELEMQMVCNLREFKEFIDNEMILILGQMDSPTEIFEHVYLGSEWNASNLEELQNSGVLYILNVTREIDNFFPGTFQYHNIRVYDEEATNLLEYWNETYKFITKAKKAGAKCLVHCKMGVSRSASTVIAYAMKEYGWDLDTAFDYVKEKRAVTKPNPAFMKQLEEYQGILLASKQRHNKLWRSHSDSDLSDRPESMCKASSLSLGRSDSYNNNNNSASSPSLHHFLGVAVLHALGAGPEDSAEERAAAAAANAACDSSDPEEVAVLLPLPAPRAATVVPEERPDDSTSVAVAVPAAFPHPPPSLHVLPPTPELRRAHRDPPTHASVSVPKHKPLELSLNSPERSSSDEISSLTLGSADSDAPDSLSDVASDERGPLGPADVALLPLAGSDDNNNPSEPQVGRGEGDGSSGRSGGESIDFFSAREKFLGLAQDGRSRTTSEQPQQRAAPFEENEDAESQEEEEQSYGSSQASPQSDDGVDKASPDRTPHDNGVSVRHIVTEIEAICHPASCLPAAASPAASPSPPSLPPSSHSPQLVRSDHQTEAEAPEAAPSSPTPPSHPPSPSMLPCDWPAGSVRRATEQLEQKLKQEMETAASQRSPLHSPGAEQQPPAVRLPPSAEHPPLDPPQDCTEQGIARGEVAADSAESEDEEKHTGSPAELGSSDLDNLPDSSCSPDSNISAVPFIAPACVDGHMFTSSLASSPFEESSLDTSAQAQRRSQPCSQIQPRQTQDASRQMTLAGATAQESDTDDGMESCSRGGGCGPSCDAESRLARGSQELERIQQTLRELQAFLHEGVGPEAPHGRDQETPGERPRGPRDVMDTEPGPRDVPSSEQTPPGPEVGRRRRERQEGRSFLEPIVWHRAMELEARIRQAGLTPPSLMKRSASLAKLDCLELSANDLSDLDLRTHPRAAATSSSSHSHDSFSASAPHADDTWKKQKVLARDARALERMGAGEFPESSSSPSLCLSPDHNGPHCCPKDDTGEREEPYDGGGAAAPARQQGSRGHSARRSRKGSAEKKQRAATVLYNTM